MSDFELNKTAETLKLTANVAVAYLSNNSVPAASLAELIARVHRALSTLGATRVTEMEKPVPPVSIKKSVTPDYLISLEDGRHYKSLKRHLAGKGLTPAQYLAKRGVSTDCPMSPPAYSARRSELARSLGLGRKRAEPAPAKRG